MAILDIVRGVGTYCSLIVLVLLAINVLAAIWSIWLVVPETADARTYLFIITPWIVNIAELSGASFATYHIIMVVLLVLSFVWLVRKSVPRFAEELLIKRMDRPHSPFYVMATLFFAALAFNMIYYSILGLFGINPVSPGLGGGELWELLYNLTRASVWEELITRVLLIGVPLLAIHLITGRRERWRSYLLGGGFKIGGIEAGLIAISSFIFATAHLFSWDVFKLPPTFIAGLALGYLFLRFGLYAAIMLHFTFDYLSVPLALWDNLAVVLILGLVVLAWLIIGIPYLAGYSLAVLNFLTKKDIWPFREKERPRPQALQAPYRPRPYGEREMAHFGFVCRYCGSTEARYRDGVFQCLRCGRIN